MSLFCQGSIYLTFGVNRLFASCVVICVLKAISKCMICNVLLLITCVTDIYIKTCLDHNLSNLIPVFNGNIFLSGTHSKHLAPAQSGEFVFPHNLDRSGLISLLMEMCNRKLLAVTVIVFTKSSLIIFIVVVFVCKSSVM